jgi:hypothetical protein
VPLLNSSSNVKVYWLAFCPAGEGRSVCAGAADVVLPVEVSAALVVADAAAPESPPLPQAANARESRNANAVLEIDLMAICTDGFLV